MTDWSARPSYTGATDTRPRRRSRPARERPGGDRTRHPAATTRHQTGSEPAPCTADPEVTSATPRGRAATSARPPPPAPRSDPVRRRRPAAGGRAGRGRCSRRSPCGPGPAGPRRVAARQVGARGRLERDGSGVGDPVRAVDPAGDHLHLDVPGRQARRASPGPAAPGWHPARALLCAGPSAAQVSTWSTETCGQAARTRAFQRGQFPGRVRGQRRGARARPGCRAARRTRGPCGRPAPWARA